MHYLSAQEAFLDPLPLFVSCAYSTYFHVLMALIFHGRMRDPDLFYEQERLFLVLQKLKDILIWVCPHAKPSHPIHHNRRSAQNSALKRPRLCWAPSLGSRVWAISTHQVSHRQPARISPDNKFRLIGLLLRMQLQ